MIKLGKLTDYAVAVLGEMALTPKARHTVVGLSRETKIPEPTIAKIMKILSKTPYIEAYRGATGGYELTHSAKDVPIRAIIEVMEGRIQIVDCASNQNSQCQFQTQCCTHGGWQLVNDAIVSALDNVFLSDMMFDRKQSKPIKVRGNQ